MKKFILVLLSAFMWFSFLFASYLSETLSHEREDSDYHNIKFYIYRYGTNFHENEARPGRLKFYSDVGIHEVGSATPSGAPASVTVIRGHMKFFKVDIPKGSSEGFSSASEGKKIKVVLLDANENPIVGEPVYYHITDFNGAQYRVHAKDGETHTVGFPVFKIHPGGEKNLFVDSGFEVLLDKNGHFKQFRDLSHIFIISYPDEKTRVMEKYAIHQMQAGKLNGFYVPGTGSKPVQSRRLYHPEPDHLRYMVFENYHNGQLYSTTTWTKGENPYLFRFQTRKAGQDILERDDHYFDDEDGVRNLIRKNYFRNGANQLHRRSFHDGKTGWHPRYQRRVKDGTETIHAYEYIEDYSSGELVQLPTLHQPAEGAWFIKKYDEVGRLTMEWGPVEEIVKEEARDPVLKDLMSLFPDPSEESIKKHQEVRFIPERAPEDLELAKTIGVVEYFSYDSHSPDDQVPLEDDRPRFLFKLKQGSLVHRKWRVYGIRESGNTYFLEEETDDPEGVFGNENHRRTLTEYFGEAHPAAPGKKSTVSYPDGSIEVYYYHKGHWNPENKFFDVHPEGKALRTEITHGTLKEGTWRAGTTSRTLITDSRENNLFEQVRELQNDGSWKNL